MEPTARLILLPLALLSLATGVVQSLGTHWGLVRHYWVIFKLLINVVAAGILLVYMETFAQMERVAGDPAADLQAVRSSSPVLHGSLALLALLIATVLAIYKPRGTTRYGWRKRAGDEALPGCLPYLSGEYRSNRPGGSRPLGRAPPRLTA